MNASNTTAHIARGIMLKAAVNNTTPSEAGGKAHQAWEAWKAGTSERMAQFAEREAYNLFDRVNAAF